MIAKEALRALGPDPWKLPPIKYPTGGPDQPTRRREDFVNLRAPRSVEGTVWIDVETGVALKSRLSAKVAAPGEDKDEATLTLKIETEVKPVEKVAVSAPDDFLPDQDRPNGIAAALERFEMQRSDGGIAAPVPGKPAEGEEPEE
jgi:hypothetical protein